MNSNNIRLEGLSKCFRVYSKPSDRFKEWVSGHRYHKEYWALKDISLEIPKGETFGIIGMNGAGKSTLLKVLTGTLAPTAGSFHIPGRVAALLELGAGFHPDLNGRDNLLLNGQLLGLSREEVNERLPSMIEFSELGDFIDQPVRTYSSGMYVRLAFSMVANVNPDVLIIDEALSVGDAYFSQKCLKRIRQFCDDGTTVLFVSHDAASVKLLCQRVALLHKGSLHDVGKPIDLLEHYNALLAQKDGNAKEYKIERATTTKEGAFSSGNQKATVDHVRLQRKELHGETWLKAEALVVGQPAQVSLTIDIHENIESPTVGIMIRNHLGIDVFGTNTHEMGLDMGVCKAHEKIRVDFDLVTNMGPGEYTVTVAVHSGRTHQDDCYQWIDRVLTFKVLPKTDCHFLGLSYLEPHVTMERFYGSKYRESPTTI
ncbi:MAG: ABC transporter ATP-binding protein [Oligoflexales bacterium]